MATASTPLLQVEHLTMRFGGLVAIDDLSFSAARGDITAIIGPNGAGKTTVFNCITGFYKPSSGRMLLSLGDTLGEHTVVLAREVLVNQQRRAGTPRCFELTPKHVAR